MSRTTKVRIPVIIDKDGRWQAGPAWSDELGNFTDEQVEFARDTCIDSGDHVGIVAKIVWVEAEIELPTEGTIQGRIFDNDDQERS